MTKRSVDWNFDKMCRESSKLYTVYSPSLVALGPRSREELIQDFLSVPAYLCTKDASGAAVMTRLPVLGISTEAAA